MRRTICHHRFLAAAAAGLLCGCVSGQLREVSSGGDQPVSRLSSDCGENRPRLIIDDLRMNNRVISFENVNMTPELEQKILELRSAAKVMLAGCITRKNRTTHVVDIVRFQDDSCGSLCASKGMPIDAKTLLIGFVDQSPFAWTQIDTIVNEGDMFLEEWGPHQTFDISGDPDFFDEHAALNIRPVDAD